MKSLVIGLTGTIASGKDSVARIFGRHGAVIIDADAIGHEIAAPRSKAWFGIVKEFGSNVLFRGGSVNRGKLAAIVFSDPRALKRLNRIMHPEMRRVIRGRIRQAKLSRRNIIVVNAALLEEMRLLSMVDMAIVVSAQKSVRVKRLVASGRSRSDALARIRSQRSDSAYRKIADHVIVNNKDIAALNEKVKRIISSL